MTQKRRILIVEDNNDIAELLSIRLGLAGYMTARAKDADSAIDILFQFKPHGVLLDIGLPGRSGLIVLQTIRSHVKMRDIPVLMLTARNSADDVKLALALGANDYVAKPFDDQKLLFRVARMLGAVVPPSTRESRTLDWR